VELVEARESGADDQRVQRGRLSRFAAGKLRCQIRHAPSFLRAIGPSQALFRAII
jgi:hypothetical protein